MSVKKKVNYTRQPTIPPTLQPLFRAVMDVQAGVTSVSEAARSLRLSRNRFQTRMHRGLEGLIAGLMDRPTGRPAAEPRAKQLLEENQRLQCNNQRLQHRLDMLDRLLNVAGTMLKNQVAVTKTSAASRQKRTPKKTGAQANDGDDDNPGPRQALRSAREMTQMGLSQTLAAAIVGVDSSTLRRWRRRQRAGTPIRETPGPAGAATPSSGTIAQVRLLLRQTKGLAGADSPRHSVPGVSRRQPAALTKTTLPDMERERIQAASRVSVTIPGIVRGFDAMHQHTTRGVRFPLVFSDASIPYRTSIPVLERYDGPSIATALLRDIHDHGAPLVYRADRYRAHDVDEITELLCEHGVLILHGPPYYPRYYGQLERENREHRSYLLRDHTFTPTTLVAACDQMKFALNELWRRPTLDWKTASEVWHQRPRVDVDRVALREEVLERAARIRLDLDQRGKPADFAMRLAIEQTLRKRGFLRLERGDMLRTFA
jgi:hypothetical protein